MKIPFKKTFGGFGKVFNISLKSIGKIPWIIGQDAFLFIILFILLGVASGEFLFYHYVFLAEAKEPQVSVVSTKFQESVYNAVLKDWQARKDIFEKSPSENYQDPFQ